MNRKIFEIYLNFEYYTIPLYHSKAREKKGRFAFGHVCGAEG